MNEEEYLEKIKHEFEEYTSNTYWLNIIIDIIDDLKEVIAESKQLQNNWNELKKLIDERIGDCRCFLANADVNYEKENMKKFMWLKEELQVLKSKVQELEQGKDEK